MVDWTDLLAEDEGWKPQQDTRPEARHSIELRPSEQEIVTTLVCHADKSDVTSSRCLSEYKDMESHEVQCWLEELWEDIGIDALEALSTGMKPVFEFDIRWRAEGYDEDYEAWVLPRSREDGGRVDMRWEE